jgi:hypothetical protein
LNVLNERQKTVPLERQAQLGESRSLQTEWKLVCRLHVVAMKRQQRASLREIYPEGVTPGDELLSIHQCIEGACAAECVDCFAYVPRNYNLVPGAHEGLRDAFE